MNPDEIVPENLKNVDIKTLALNSQKFGELTFDRSYPLLEKLRQIFVDLEEFDYRSLLIPSQINQIESERNQLVELLRRLATYSLAEGFNRDSRDGFENEVENLYRQVMNETVNRLTFLRQEQALTKTDEKKLDSERKEVAKIKAEYQKIVKELTDEKQKYNKETAEAAKAKIERVAVFLGKHFELQATQYHTEASKWNRNRVVLFWTFLIIVALNVVAYLTLLITFHANIRPHFNPANIFDIQYAIFKIALLGLISWAMGFASRNYHINSNLEAVNLHRKNVAETMRDFTKNDATDVERSEMLRIGAEALFKHLPTGYMGKDGSTKEDGPVEKIINNFITGKQT